MKAFGKALFATGLLMYSSSLLAADTLKIHLTNKHRLDKEGHTLGFVTICQKFYTPEQQLFREINYNEQNGQISNYTFYFYSNGKLFTEECYNQNDSLLYILKHGYDASGRENLVERLVPLNGRMDVAGKTTYTYDKTGKLHQQKDYFGKKVGSTKTCVYNADGNLQSENQECKSFSKSNFKSETRSYIYGSDKKLNRVEISGKDLGGKSFQRSEVYTYDKNGNLSGVSITGNDIPGGLVKSYNYVGSGLISLYQESNAAGIFSLILQYDYKKHFMERGTQVSYFAAKK